jgi:alpha-tubulin suppressor-like RCC1 family protein
MKPIKYFRLLSIMGFVFLNNVINAQQTITLTPSKDAHLYMTLKPGYAYYANTNYGTSNRFYSGEWSATNYRVNQRSVMDFDLSGIPADAVIVEASLSLFSMQPQTNDDYRHGSYIIPNNTGSKPNTSYLERITSSWTETEVTYNTQPSTTAENRIILPESQTTNQDYLDLDVTAMVKDMVNNPSESFGFMIRLVDEVKYCRMAFCSSNHADPARHPKLVIKYTLASKLSVFNDYSLLLKADGSLWGWGCNSSGNLGDGTATDRYAPVKIGANDWKQISAGWGHSLAIKADGTLWAWGLNISGQLGDGTSTERRSPVQVGIAANWEQVAAGYLHSAAIKTDGTLWAWGSNTEGQLGNGTTYNRFTPTQVGTSSDWMKIVAGENFMMAIKTDGTLWAWGSNDYGQLGDETTTDKYTPVQIGTESDWKNISTGGNHSLAVKKNGTLWAWGDNSNGQLGDGTRTNRLTAVRIGTTSDWNDIDAGYNHSLATRTDGTLWAWGNNNYGQLGNGSIGNAEFLPELVEDISGCIQIAAGSTQSLVLKADDQYCGVGGNNYGQLGDGTTKDKTLFNCVTFAMELKSTKAKTNLIEADLKQANPSTPSLFQNYPNPTQGFAIIDYCLSADANDAKIIIYNTSNTVVKQYSIADKGSSNIEVDLQDHPSGVYFYVLYINGTKVDQKKLIISR